MNTNHKLFDLNHPDDCKRLLAVVFADNNSNTIGNNIKKLLLKKGIKTLKQCKKPLLLKITYFIIKDWKCMICFEHQTSKMFGEILLLFGKYNVTLSFAQRFKRER